MTATSRRNSRRFEDGSYAERLLQISKGLEARYQARCLARADDALRCMGDKEQVAVWLPSMFEMKGRLSWYFRVSASSVDIEEPRYTFTTPGHYVLWKHWAKKNVPPSPFLVEVLEVAALPANLPQHSDVLFLPMKSTASARVEASATMRLLRNRSDKAASLLFEEAAFSMRKSKWSFAANNGSFDKEDLRQELLVHAGVAFEQYSDPCTVPPGVDPVNYMRRSGERDAHRVAGALNFGDNAQGKASRFVSKLRSSPEWCDNFDQLSAEDLRNLWADEHPNQHPPALVRFEIALRSGGGSPTRSIHEKLGSGGRDGISTTDLSATLKAPAKTLPDQTDRWDLESEMAELNLLALQMGVRGSTLLPPGAELVRRVWLNQDLERPESLSDALEDLRYDLDQVLAGGEVSVLPAVLRDRLESFHETSTLDRLLTSIGEGAAADIDRSTKLDLLATKLGFADWSGLIDSVWEDRATRPSSVLGCLRAMETRMPRDASGVVRSVGRRSLDPVPSG